MDKNSILKDVENYASELLSKREFVPFEDEVPVSGASITPNDIASVVDTILNGWFTEHETSKRFEQAIKEYLGVHHVSLCNSGSSASLLATTALNHTHPGNRNKSHLVITCATGFPTTVFPIYQNNLVPLFVDSKGYKELNADVNTVLELLQREDVCGVSLAHTLGFPFRADLIREECDRLGKWFLEDCCDALGAEINGIKCGNFGHASTLSFFPAHQITTGEGGAVLTNNGRLYKEINSYRDWGRACWCLPGQQNTCGKRFGWDYSSLPEGWDHKYTFTNLGYNLKITDMQSALGLSQIKRIEKFKYQRQINYANLLFTHLIGNYPNDHLWCGWYDIDIIDELGNSEWDYSPFGVPITVTTDAFTKKELVNFLESRKIRTRPVFGGNLTRQPAIRNRYYEQVGFLENSDYIMERTFWIGTHPNLTQKQIDFVIQSFEDFFKMKGLR